MNSAKSALEQEWQDRTFVKILHDMNAAGNFKASFLVDGQGPRSVIRKKVWKRLQDTLFSLSVTAGKKKLPIRKWKC